MNALTLPASGDLFVYESAASQITENRVRVRPDNGGEIILRPGQQFRAPKTAERWNVRSFTGAENIDGFFIIGNGDFRDSNTKNTVTLDATFANAVTVMNDTAHRVPVTLDAAQAMPVTIAAEVEVKNDSGNPLAVSLAGVGQVQENLIAYTGCLTLSAASLSGAQQVVAPATNVNGIIVNRFIFKNTNTQLSVLAKASAPVNNWDGDVLEVNDAAVVAGYLRDDTKIKIPPGKGLYLYGQLGGGNYTMSLVYTIL